MVIFKKHNTDILQTYREALFRTKIGKNSDRNLVHRQPASWVKKVGDQLGKKLHLILLPTDSCKFPVSPKQSKFQLWPSIPPKWGIFSTESGIFGQQFSDSLKFRGGWQLPLSQSVTDRLVFTCIQYNGVRIHNDSSLTHRYIPAVNQLTDFEKRIYGVRGLLGGLGDSGLGGSCGWLNV